MKNKKILFIIHRLYFGNLSKKGGIDHIFNFLTKQNQIDSIEHPFENINHPSIFTRKGTKHSYIAKLKTPFIWLEEIFINIFWVLKYKENYDLAIGSDPLNLFSCYLLKKLRKVRRTQFHSIDYSPIRFTNRILNFIYLFLYRFSLQKADYTTVISQRMLENAYRLLNLKKKTNNIYLLPNSPVFTEINRLPIEKRKKEELVLTIGLFKDQVDLDRLIDCLVRLKTKNPKNILNIIGYVDPQSIDKFYAKKIDKNVVFHGFLPYDKSIEIIAESYIGITCYSRISSYTKYGDSLKIREYAAAGLPIVCDDIYSTSEEVKKYRAGFVYKNSQEMSEMIYELIKNKKIYQQMSNNALNWAKKMDKKKLLLKLYNSKL